MPTAYLTDRTALTAAKVRQRIQAGAPMYGTSPDRPFDAVRRVPYGTALSPEAYDAIITAPRRSFMQAGDADIRNVKDNGAIYSQAQTLLAIWRRAGGPCDPPDFGANASDMSGTDDPRTVRAIRSFQRWANTQGANIRDDGVLDDLTLGQLFISTADAANKASQKPKSMIPTWLLVGGLVGVVAWLEYGTATVRRGH